MYPISRPEYLLLTALSYIVDEISQHRVSVVVMPSSRRTSHAGSISDWTESELREAQLAYYLLAAVGIGYLFAFSALTQPVDYWHQLFLDFNIEFYVSTLYVWVNLVMLAAIVCFGGVPIIKSRMNIGFYGQLLVLIVLPTSWFFGLSEICNFWLVLGCTAFVAVATAFTASSAIALTAQYPPQVQAGYQLGIGLSTLLGSVFRIVTKLVVPEKMVIASSLLYFYASAAAVAGCIVAYEILHNLDISKKHVTYGLDSQSQLQMQVVMTPVASYNALTFLEHSVEEGLEIIPIVETSPSREDATSDFGFYEIRSRVPSEATIEHIVPYGGSMDYDSFTESSRLLPVIEVEVGQEVSQLSVLLKVLQPLSSVFLIFCSTLVLWPSIVTEIDSFNFSYLQKTKWWSLILLFSFALFDCAGRFVVEYRKYVTKDTIWIFSLLRLCLIPPLLCCAKGWFIFTNDLWSILLVSLLGVSNGYLGSISIILVNDFTDSKEETGTAGVLTGFIINVALATGATISLGLHRSLFS